MNDDGLMCIETHHPIFSSAMSGESDIHKWTAAAPM